MEKEVVETIYGKYNKFEIVKDPGGVVFGRIKFYVYRDGKYWKGYYTTLSAAVADIENER